MRRLHSESLSPEFTNYQNEYASLQSELTTLNYYFLLQKAFKVGIPDQAFFCAYDEVEQQILQLMQKLERHIFVTVTDLYEPSVQDGDVLSKMLLREVSFCQEMWRTPNYIQN